MSNQSLGCDKCYANNLILQGENLQIIRVNRMLQIISHPTYEDEGEIESMCMNMNFCPDCGHDYNSDERFKEEGKINE